MGRGVRTLSNTTHVVKETPKMRYSLNGGKGVEKTKFVKLFYTFIHSLIKISPLQTPIFSLPIHAYLRYRLPNMPYGICFNTAQHVSMMFYAYVHDLNPLSIRSACVAL